MPTYGYACENCEHEFDEFQSITAKPLRKCPACGKLKLKRLIGAGAGIIFKGSGFYQTDYRSDSYKSEAKSDTGGGAKKPDKTESKTGSASSETKPRPPRRPARRSRPEAVGPFETRYKRKGTLCRKRSHPSLSPFFWSVVYY